MGGGKKARKDSTGSQQGDNNGGTKGGDVFLQTKHKKGPTEKKNVGKKKVEGGLWKKKVKVRE